ncbi:hypothetical protein PanWU01x14_333360 [Parasponia andersonii]|uniref:Uncharacterized protein n=1 Tax=Parasponia andersonii TaxID=3476 RepID=A0A2P5AGZ9_PARAD|nr:hypothetical protein PanWU01x14_333360 [Parasponia andersonii]
MDEIKEYFAKINSWLDEFRKKRMEEQSKKILRKEGLKDSKRVAFHCGCNLSYRFLIEGTFNYLGSSDLFPAAMNDSDLFPVAMDESTVHLNQVHLSLELNNLTSNIEQFIKYDEDNNNKHNIVPANTGATVPISKASSTVRKLGKHSCEDRAEQQNGPDEHSMPSFLYSRHHLI